MRRSIALSLQFLLCGCATPGLVFPTPEACVQALADSAGDRRLADELLGPGGFELLRSGDDVADREDIAAVRAMIAAGVAFDDDGAHKIALLGADAWPLPLPLVRSGDGWRFDVEAGAEEVLSRRVGRNELSTIAVLRACVDAQLEYASEARDGNAPCFAARWVSSEGKHDGLWWPDADGEPASPLGPLVADAAAEGYREPHGAELELRPYHGYCFRLLTAQGDAAPGGARDYLDAEGRLSGGFAFVAWPAAYGSSGVMTFVVNRLGVVYQKDLGAETGAAVDAITSFDPGEGWEPVVE